MADFEPIAHLTFPKIATLTDKFGNTFNFGNAGDYWHPPFPIGENNDYRSLVRNIRDMEIRDDDILICSFPKTGMHWTHEMISMLLKQSTEMKKDDVSSVLDLIPTTAINSLPSPRILITHVPFRYVPKQALEKKTKIIFLERNPKDVLVSYYCQQHSQLPPFGFTGTFEHFYRLYMDCGYYYGDLFDYLMEWQNGLESYPDTQVCVSVYEDMKQDPVAGIAKLNDYLNTGASRKLCEEIVESCGFKKMQAFKNAEQTELMEKAFKKNASGFYRKGEVGDWKNWFTVAMNEEFDDEYKKRMSKYKLQYKYTLD